MELALDDSINMSNDNNRGGGRSRRGRSSGGRGGGPMGGRRNRGPPSKGGTKAGNGRKIYVGNLSWDTDWKQLKDHVKGLGFPNIGNVEVMESGGRSKGWGTIEFDKPSTASAAVRQIHDTELNGRPIFAREDREEGVSGVDNRSIYVGNLPWSVKWQNLKDVFADFGAVEYADVATEGGRPNGRSLGWGTVRYQSANAALKAIQSMNGRVMDGREIEVRYDNKAGGGGGNNRQNNNNNGGSFKGGNNNNNRNNFNNNNNGGNNNGGNTSVYIGNLPWEVRWQDLKDTFKQYGNIEFAEVATEGGRPNGRSMGWGTVRFTNASSAIKAINDMHGREMDGRTIECRYDQKR